MTLNNKGFAITGILYTLFILFLLILVSVLGGLSSRKKMIEWTAKNIENSFDGKVRSGSTYVDSDSYSANLVNTFNTNKITPVLGRYKFKLSEKNVDEIKCDEAGNGYFCYAYFNKNISLENLNEITYTNSDCNTYKGSYNIKLCEIVSFEKE